jgi:arylamine N-acetyltransferase
MTQRDSLGAFCRKFSLARSAGEGTGPTTSPAASSSASLSESNNEGQSSDDDDTLRRAVFAFANVPYENLTKIIRLASGAELDSLFRTPDEVLGGYLSFGTGGTCYSMTYCLRQLLARLGVHADPVTADRTYGEDTHCCLIVERKGKRFLVDPGFLILQPVELPVGKRIIETPVSKLAIEKVAEDRFTVSTIEKDGEHFRYLLKAEFLSDEEFKDQWKRSFSFQMMKSILITSVLDDRQVYLHNSYLQFTREGSRQKSEIGSNYERTVSQLFGISEEVVKRAIDILGPQFLRKR